MGDLVMGDDGLPAELVGEWAKEKHSYLKTYLDLSRGARNRFLRGPAKSATYIDLFCGPGRARVKETGEWIEGGVVAAWNSSVASGAPFTQIFIADTDEERRQAAVTRLKKLRAPVFELNASAVEAASQVTNEAPQFGLHFAFIDPWNLEELDFQIIESLSRLKRIDMLFHFSIMDHQRNLDRNLSPDDSAFDRFAPGWREHISMEQSKTRIRADVIEYWKNLIARRGTWLSDDVKLITGSRNQRLYWLLLAAKHDLAHKFWGATVDTDKQGRLF